MANIVTPDEGELELLDKALKDALTVDENYLLKLYRNDYTPVQGSTATNFTAATFTNYAIKTLTRAGWNSATTVSNKAKSVYGTQQSWTCGSTGDTVYGYWVEGATSGKVLWAQRLDSAQSMTENSIINITPALTLNAE